MPVERLSPKYFRSGHCQTTTLHSLQNNRLDLPWSLEAAELSGRAQVPAARLRSVLAAANAFMGRPAAGTLPHEDAASLLAALQGVVG